VDNKFWTDPRLDLLDNGRFRGHRGGVIQMHRALNHFQLTPLDLVTSILIFVFFSALWVLVLPFVCSLWEEMFRVALARLPLHARLESVTYHWKLFQLSIPCLRIEPVFSSLRLWLWNSLATALLFFGTFFLSQALIPVVYLTRSVLLVHASALIYFAILPASFPHTPDSYMEGLVVACLGLISVVPLLFAMTYYIFDFGLLKKCALTAMTMMHLVVFMPFQLILQGLILQKSLLFMPALYIIFGLPVDILVIIAFYSWGMSWHFRVDGKA
jgi:hypothetical protein